MRASYYLVLLIVVISMHAHAQVQLKGVLRNGADSTVIPFAAVTMAETNVTVLTNEKGEFSFYVHDEYARATLTIAAIGIKQKTIINSPAHKNVTIYLDVSENALDGVAIQGLSAEQVVRRAVAAIPQNYADSSYFDYSFYRRYQTLNGRYVNLMEAFPVVMFRLASGDHSIASQEAYAVSQLRRSKFIADVSNVVEDNPADLLCMNPVYHLQGSSLFPGRFSSCTFRFDTANHSRVDYLITYTCNISSTDEHGVPDYRERNLKGETWETGELVIDRTSFAIKRFHRVSHRHKDYDYRYFPPLNNLVTFGYHEYAFSFIGGDMLVEYEQYNGKWYLSKLLRKYTDDFNLHPFPAREFSITDCFEWYSGGRSRYTTDEFVDKFFPKMSTAIFNYDTAFWNRALPAFYYADEVTLRQHLAKDGPLSRQFEDESKIDEPQHKPHRSRKDQTGILMVSKKPK